MEFYTALLLREVTASHSQCPPQHMHACVVAADPRLTRSLQDVYQCQPFSAPENALGSRPPEPRAHSSHHTPNHSTALKGRSRIGGWSQFPVVRKSRPALIAVILAGRAQQNLIGTFCGCSKME